MLQLPVFCKQQGKVASGGGTCSVPHAQMLVLDVGSQVHQACHSQARQETPEFPCRQAPSLAGLADGLSWLWLLRMTFRSSKHAWCLSTGCLLPLSLSLAGSLHASTQLATWAQMAEPISSFLRTNDFFLSCSLFSLPKHVKGQGADLGN